MTLLALIGVLIQLYVLVLIARVILSWMPVSPGSPWEPLYRFVFAVTEPPLAAIRSVVPPVRMGAGALDLSPFLLTLGLMLLWAIISR